MESTSTWWHQRNPSGHCSILRCRPAVWRRRPSTGPPMRMPTSASGSARRWSHPAVRSRGPGSLQGPRPSVTRPSLTSWRRTLAPLAAATATKELDIALVGDVSFSASHPGAAGDMLVRLNNVDGIFSSQVGVTITTSVLKVLSAASDGGLASADAGILLDQFEVYRKATPDAASRGLAHLLTGRDLDGSTVGIAYRGTVCERDFAVSLSQQSSDSWTGSLIMAHELGHNFGAPHDGTAGSACAGTAMTFLMSPQINGSSTFSQCSLSVMAPVVSAAACFTAKRLAEVAVEVASAELQRLHRTGRRDARRRRLVGDRPGRQCSGDYPERRRAREFHGKPVRAAHAQPAPERLLASSALWHPACDVPSTLRSGACRLAITVRPRASPPAPTAMHPTIRRRSRCRSRRRRTAR